MHTASTPTRYKNEGNHVKTNELAIYIRTFTGKLLGNFKIDYCAENVATSNRIYLVSYRCKLSKFPYHTRSKILEFGTVTT